jgi:LmbE family N-acetylglucosaminyl deacetylase
MPEVSRPGGLLPTWASVLVVVAHPDDETFGLGAILARMAASGTAVHILCFTHGEASTLNQSGADLRRAREQELLQASGELGAASCTLLDYPDGSLAASPPGDLAGHTSELVSRWDADGLLAFDETGVTGHPDHQAATSAAVAAAAAAGLPVLAWTLPAAIASRLREETGGPFAGQLPASIDLCVRVDRARQRRAALMHTTQVSPTAVLWRRLQLQGDREHLRWLITPGQEPAKAGARTRPSSASP